MENIINNIDITDLSVYQSKQNKINITDDDLPDIENDIYEMMNEYMITEIINMSSPNFYKDFIEGITDLIYDYWFDCGICDEDDYDDIEEFIEQLTEIYFDICDIPMRTSYHSINDCKNITNDENVRFITEQLKYLKNIPQAKQKTLEWYQFRYNLITASNLWKVFGSDANRNSLIYEKCKPFDTFRNENTNCNVESTLHWGVRYEPISVMIYENMYNTKVDEFGCIPHNKYNFIGASPDGINNDINNKILYGRMIEIKNIYNRDITGIPKQEYWVQTQIQMECCNLNECDFVETRFKEYANETSFYQDDTHDYKGVILYFIHRTNNISIINTLSEMGTINHYNIPIYKYMPVNNSTDIESVSLWINSMKDTYKNEYILFNTIYWYLDEFSCVLIKRNRQWFDNARPKIEDLWNIILKERVDGYQHRASKKRICKTEVIIQTNPDLSNTHIIKNLPITNHICLVKLE